MDATVDSRSRRFRFSQYRWLTLALFIAFVATLFFYVGAENRIDRTDQARQRLFLLAQELRQSSDDLTRMARSYVVTGSGIYRQRYQEILDIRDGRRPRRAGDQSIGWGPTLASEVESEALERATPLLALIQAAGVSTEEFRKLLEAKSRSDSLSRTERAAMALIEPSNPTASANRERAIGMLHEATYERTKAGIMQPITEFQRMADLRMQRAMGAAETEAMRLRIALAVLGLLLAWLMWNVWRDLRAILGGSVTELHARIMRLGNGDFSTSIPIRKGMENSVLGWLSETQIGLARIETQRKAAETRNYRLTQLYAALSECNQAIVRSIDETALFEQVCRAVVSLGGMKMAWIGMLDETNRSLLPVAAFGDGTAYVEGLQLSTESTHPTGGGPAGTAFRSDQPFWCQDFLHDPATLPWHERALAFGWKASAALPLHRDGAVVGIFSLYADVINAFDEEVRGLLTEMATDIDYALKSFARERLREHAEKALRENEQRLRTIIETEPECIMLVDGDGHLLEMNAAGLAMLEAESLDQARQRDIDRYVLPAYRDAFRALRRRVLDGDNGMLEYEIDGLKGTRRWLETHAAPMRNAHGGISLLLGITRDVTARKQAEDRIQYMAHFDALTGLPNRAQLDDRTRYAISLAQRSHESLALMFLDLDRFKDINDTLGHSIGDALLVELAARLQRELRDEDTVSRLGGDEFIFLLYGVDAPGAAHVAQKLLDVIAQPYRIEQHDLNVSGSIGIALFPADGNDLETLSRSADAAMYRVKQDGRNGYRFFTPEMQASSASHLKLVSALRQAVPNGQLQLYYQPQLSLQDGRVVGVEALLRWTHPELGVVPSTVFIPAAEDSGLILPIGEWVLRQAARQARAWMQDDMPPLIMAVNLSAVQFRHPDLPQLIARILEEEQLPPEYLELELTESVAMHAPAAATALMNKLHDRGVRMSIDDFGTGYSSLSYLKKFKVYKLKIDQSFVRDISTDVEDRAIVGAIIHMAKSLGLQTIAEGVETEGQLAFLREQGCDEVQGYYYSRPLPADQCRAFARSRI